MQRTSKCRWGNVTEVWVYLVQIFFIISISLNFLKTSHKEHVRVDVYCKFLALQVRSHFWMFYFKNSSLIIFWVCLFGEKEREEMSTLNTISHCILRPASPASRDRGCRCVLACTGCPRHRTRISHAASSMTEHSAAAGPPQLDQTVHLLKFTVCNLFSKVFYRCVSKVTVLTFIIPN